MYVLRSDDVAVEVRNESNVIRTIPLDQSLGFTHWLAVRPDGTVFVTIGSTLLRVGPGAAQAEVIATDLVDRRAAFADVHDRHAMMGTWIAPDGAVFVTDFVGQTVRRVEPGDTASATTAFWRAKDEWSATGGMTMRDGTVLLLEWSTRNDVRVRRIRTDGSSTVLGQG